MRVDHARDALVVDVAALAGDLLDDGDALLLRLVREHRATHHVANRIDARHVGGKVVVDLHLAASVDLDAHVVKPQALGHGRAASGDEDDVRLQRLRLAAVLGVDLELGAARGQDGGGVDLGRELEVHALQRVGGEEGEEAASERRDVRVGQGEHRGAERRRAERAALRRGRHTPAS